MYIFKYQNNHYKKPLTLKIAIDSFSGDIFSYSSNSKENVAVPDEIDRKILE